MWAEPWKARLCERVVRMFEFPRGSWAVGDPVIRLGRNVVGDGFGGDGEAEASLARGS